ncbi:MAG: bifunctional phosphopantothenoylcysteine decarboxylase/phosphopantothenate--cysteine ligase CoaBC [Gammaproteobacteria bacterium]|nr:bifunctional phosphopantothenoylcysteine decarboxylase/phosphopantothenate--cysteine ligase CoaBC [Gammaproteobacteria bacterium]
MNILTKRRIIVGVTGSIAAYKSAELVRRLRSNGTDVRVAMTAGATRFIAPLTFQALSANRVHQHLLDESSEAAMGHIELARWADAVIIAPASADFIARLSHGRADDLLAALCLATAAPVAVAPAMNHRMWAHAATQENVQRLQDRGVSIFGPAEGEQACGESGLGRMLEVTQLLALMPALLGDGPLRGRCVVVSAGPTYEDIDPVRFIGNRSSGKMGYALALAAAAAGARVTLVSGPCALPDPGCGIIRISVRSAEQMYGAVLHEMEACDIFISAAAVADYRPRSVSAHKIKKHSNALTLELERTDDILGQVSALKQRPFCVGFAAETDDLEENARAKLNAKSLDLVAANQVGVAGSGFDSDENALTLYWRDGTRQLPRASKQALATALVTIIAERLHEKYRTENS